MQKGPSIPAWTVDKKPFPSAGRLAPRPDGPYKVHGREAQPDAPGELPPQYNPLSSRVLNFTIKHLSAALVDAHDAT